VAAFTAPKWSRHAAWLAQGRHPSIDAVRIALGNTGSKSTIHRLLREIEADEAVDAHPPAAIASTLQTAVARLAQDIESAADERIARAQNEATQTIATLRADRDLARQDCADALNRVNQQQSAIDRLTEELATSRRTVEQLVAQNRTTDAVVQGLRERLDDRQQLEDQLQRRADALTTRLGTMQHSLDALLTRADDTTANRLAIQAQRDASRLQARAGRTGRVRLGADLAAARSTNAVLRGEINTLTAAVTMAESRVHEAERQSQRDRITWSTTLSECNDRLQALVDQSLLWKDTLQQLTEVANGKSKPPRKSTKMPKRKESAP